MESTEHLPSGEIRQINQAPQPPASTPPPSLYISVKDTAKLLGVTPVTVYRRYHAGLLPGRKFGRIDILRTFVEAFVAEIAAGRSPDVDTFAAAWTSRVSEDAA